MRSGGERGNGGRLGGKGKGGTFSCSTGSNNSRRGLLPHQVGRCQERKTYLPRSTPFGPAQARNGPVPPLPSRHPCSHAKAVFTLALPTPHDRTATPCPASQAVQRAGSTSWAPASLRVPQRVLLRQGHVQDHARSVGAALWRARRGVNGVGPCNTQRTA